MQAELEQKKKTPPETFYDQHHRSYRDILKCWEKTDKHYKVWKTETKTGFSGQEWAYINNRNKADKIKHEKSWIYTNRDIKKESNLRINVIWIFNFLSIFSDLTL